MIGRRSVWAAVVAAACAWWVTVDHGPPRAVVGWFDGGYEAPLPLAPWPVVDVVFGGDADVGGLADELDRALGDVGGVARVDRAERVAVVVPAAADRRDAVEGRLGADRAELEILPVEAESHEVATALRHWVGYHREAWGEVEGAPGALLEGPTEEAIAAAIAGAAEACAGCRVSPPLAVRYEEGRVYRASDGSEREVVVAYLVSRGEPRLDGRYVAAARVVFDERNRPVVMVEFDAEGAERFADLTERQAGEKVAIVVDGRVMSAPVVMERIEGGRAQIAMGSELGAAETVEEARRLASRLAPGVALPAGTTWTWRESPGASEGAVVAARAATALGAALVVLLLGGLLGRWARLAPAGPTVHALADAAEGALAAAGRVGLTLAAGAGAWALSRVTVFGVEDHGEVDWGAVAVVDLGLAPVLLAFLLVHLVVWVVPPLRALRRGGRGARRRLLPATLALALGLSGLQAFGYGQIMSEHGAIAAGVGPLLVVVGSLVGGVLALWAVAAVVSRWGVGDGFVVLTVATTCGLVVEVDGMSGSAVALLGALGLLYVHLCGRRVGVGEGARAMPLGGLVALDLVAVLGMLALGLAEVEGGVMAEMPLPVRLAALVVVGVGLAWVTARPIAAGALARGAVVSVGALALVVVTQALVASGGAFVPGDLALIAGMVSAPALVLDFAGEAWVTARHGALVEAWSGHGVDEARGYAEALAQEGVPFALRSVRYRALTRFMGPWAHVAVLVPATHAARAERLLYEREHAALIEPFGDGPS